MQAHWLLTSSMKAKVTNFYSSPIKLLESFVLFTDGRSVKCPLVGCMSPLNTTSSIAYHLYIQPILVCCPFTMSKPKILLCLFTTSRSILTTMCCQTHSEVFAWKGASFSKAPLTWKQFWTLYMSSCHKSLHPIRWTKWCSNIEGRAGAGCPLPSSAQCKPCDILYGDWKWDPTGTWEERPRVPRPFALLYEALTVPTVQWRPYEGSNLISSCPDKGWFAWISSLQLWM
jgi:hypothetical protein